MSSIYLLSCSTNPYQFESTLLCSLGQKFGYNVVLCGTNKKWEGWITKITSINDALKNLNQSSLCVITDAYDVLPVRNSSTLLSDYNSFNKKIIVGAETHCGSNCRKLVQYYTMNQIGTYNYVNGGLLMGYVSDLSTMFQNYIQGGYTDDQLALSNYIDQNPTWFYVDNNAKIFMNTVVIDNVTTANENIVQDASLKGLKQYFVHYPGLNTHESQQINYQNSLSKVLAENNMKNIVSFRSPRALTGTGWFLVVCLITWAILATVFAFYFYNQMIRSAKV